MVCMRASAFSHGTGPAVRSIAANEYGGVSQARPPGVCLPRVFHGPGRVKQRASMGGPPILRLSILGDFGVGCGKLTLDIERRTALCDQHAVQRADVSALTVILLKRSKALVGAAEPAGEGLHCRGCGRFPFGLGLGG